MIPFLKKHFAPNRVVVYLVAASALGSALVVPLTDVGAEGAAAIISSVLVFAGVVAKWLGGWQSYEKALLQRDLIAYESKLAVDRVDAQRAVGQAGSRAPRVNLPR